jgi:catechol 2,3-dioxygenase-like lactoylglutathione lyase family enzyme
MPDPRQHIDAAAYLVRNYDEAISWFTEKLEFSIAADRPLGGGKRWVLMAASQPSSFHLLLARAEGAKQKAAVGQAAGGRVAYFLHCDDFAATHKKMQEKGVRFLEQPRHESYGIVAVFEDLYGNKWDLIEPAR